MPKNIDDMIVPERRKSIRNIPIPEGRRKADKTSKIDGVKRPAPKVESEPEADYSAPPHRLNIPRRSHRSKRRIWLAGAAATLILIIALLSMFNGATLAYVPRSAALTFNNETHVAKKTGDSGLLYSVVKLSGDKSAEVSISGEQEVERKASGTIIVYNTGADSQKLIETTRFESPSGKIYRIDKAITIPAKGSVEAIVYADVAGTEYNSTLTDFTVPGLKGTSRYSTIYARSKTAISGGLVGKEKVVSPADLAKAKSTLQGALSEDLIAKAQAEVPADFILFSSLSSVTFEDLPQSAAGKSSDKTMVNLRGHLYGIMFKRSDLARELGKQKAGISSQELVDLESLQDLRISFAGTPPADLLPLNEISLKVNGPALLVWRTDEVALRSDLAGRSKRDVPTILNNYPTIATATATVRPFWKSTFPSESEKISIKKMGVE